MKKILSMIIAIAALLPGKTDACTGITLTTKDNAKIMARTIEWGGSDLNSQYIIVPRGYTSQSYIPGGTDGMKFTSKYGYVGLAVEQKEFVAEGLNEEGLSAGLFYFPQYGKYEAYNESEKASSIADLQLVSYILGVCKNLDEVKKAIEEIHVIAIDPRASTAHWRFSDKSGKQIVLEIIDGKTVFYDNELEVLTNSPDFDWQMTNLNNYVNLFPGSVSPQKLGNVEIKQFGVGSGFLGIPGDVTPPSRFVRAALYQANSPIMETPEETVIQAFQILNNFDIPIGIEFNKGQTPADIPSATQWTSATDMNNLKIYFRTMYNSAIRCIDLNDIDFTKTKYKNIPLDTQKQQPIYKIKVK